MIKALLKFMLAAGLAVALGANVAAAEKAKERTIKGKGCCAKCALHKTDKCQDAIVVKNKRGKEVVYYLEGEAAKDFHKNICKGSKPVVAKGTVKVEDGKHILKVTEIKVAESSK